MKELAAFTIIVLGGLTLAWLCRRILAARAANRLAIEIRKKNKIFLKRVAASESPKRLRQMIVSALAGMSSAERMDLAALCLELRGYTNLGVVAPRWMNGAHELVSKAGKRIYLCGTRDGAAVTVSKVKSGLAKELAARPGQILIVHSGAISEQMRQALKVTQYVRLVTNRHLATLVAQTRV